MAIDKLAVERRVPGKERPVFLVRFPWPSTLSGCVGLLGVPELACAVAALLVAAGVAAGVPACGGVGFGLVTGFAAGISVVGLMEMFGFVVAVFVFTVPGLLNGVVSVVDVPGAGASPPQPTKPIATIPNPAKYFMGRSKHSRQSVTKPFVASRPFARSFPALAVAENQPARLVRIKNRMTSLSTLADACEAVMTFISRGNESPQAAEFNQLALGLFGFQFTQNEAYANLCQSEKRTRTR